MHSELYNNTVSQTHAQSPSPSRGLQEMRECAVRGLDGPGLFALDVHPQSWAHLPGYEEALARRAADLEALKVQGPFRAQSTCEITVSVSSHLFFTDSNQTELRGEPRNPLT